jgi:two-component system, OmpR family, response regulator
MESADAVSVLVVDDAPDLTEAIGLALSMKGYSVRTACDGLGALVLIEQAQPHCVILDVRMPRLNGHAFARELRARYRDDIVLIAMSGFEPDDPAVKGTFEIVDHYLRKPFDFAELDKILPSLI